MANRKRGRPVGSGAGVPRPQARRDSVLVGVALDAKTLALVDARIDSLRKNEGVEVSRQTVIRGLIRAGLNGGNDT